MVHVVHRLLRIARANWHRFETSSALPLCSMSFSDSVSQLSQAIFHFLTRTPALRSFPSELLAHFCRMNLFLIHATSAFSVWCWLLLSVLRYVAVFHPLTYPAFWRQPRYAVLLVGFKSCSENTDSFLATSTQAYHLLDIALSYVVPACLRIVLDGVVLSHCYNPFRAVRCPPLCTKKKASAPLRTSGDTNKLYHSLPQKTASVRKGKKRAMIVRSVAISVVNLCCNLPSHLLRLLLTLEDEPTFISHEWIDFVEVASQMLYFSQFTCNALYLSTTTYETTPPNIALPVVKRSPNPVPILSKPN
ncbi:hypothetical protein QR680_017302 [Steinernema hermaphroditum]|uniref:G-protein coupled receptors family 1 profile domain-containing protein n=1 Tax=Steinernema hermaphroditum TaxID=289476 RepID=A0AA39HG23_9BILA|nr:hypothetical protein QR680_017302 [Steinernema hermaphroditum]